MPELAVVSWQSQPPGLLDAAPQVPPELHDDVLRVLGWLPKRDPPPKLPYCDLCSEGPLREAGAFARRQVERADGARIWVSSVCKFCSDLNDQRHSDVANRTITFLGAKTPENITDEDIDHALELARAVVHAAEINKQRQDMSPQQRYKDHIDQLGLCTFWALDRGLHPAHDHRHRAPDGAAVTLPDGTDRTIEYARFYYCVPPWRPDGSVNPAGVAPSDPAAPAFVPEDKGPGGYICRAPNCGKWQQREFVREFAGRNEPHDWWWCEACRRSRPKPSKRELEHEREASTCRKIDGFVRVHDYNKRSRT